MRRVPLLLAVVVVAACGSSKNTAPPPPTTTAPPSPTAGIPGGEALYVGGNWAVVLAGDQAVAVHLVNTTWHTDRSGRVRIAVLGPKPGSVAPKLPQVAAELRAPRALVETGLWVDGKELVVKGGGSPLHATIYGAPTGNLSRGQHVAIAYGRTATTGTARAWSFRVR